MTVYPDTLATSAQYATWTGTTSPGNIDQVLRSCTQLVLDATKLAYYFTDETGAPTDDAVAKVLADATCIQAAAWVALNIDPLTGGALVTSKIASSKKIGTAVIAYADGETAVAVAARQAAYTGLVPDAARKLRLNNLLAFAPRRAR